MQAVVEWLQMDVGGAQLDHAPDDGVDQADDGRLARQVAQVFDEIARVALVGQRVVCLHGLGVVQRALQRLVDVRAQRDSGPHLKPCGQVQRLDDKSVLRRAHCDVQHAIFGAQWQYSVRAEKLRQQGLQFGRCLWQGIRGDERQLQVLGQRLRGVGLRHQAEVDQHTIEGATHFALRRQRALQIARGQPAGAHQQVAVIRPADAAQCG